MNSTPDAPLLPVAKDDMVSTQAVRSKAGVETMRDQTRKSLTQPSKTLNIILLVIITILGLLLFIFFDMDEITAFIQNNPSWVVGISLFVFAILGFTIIPSTPISILLAAILSPWEAVLWGTIGMTLSSLVEYFVARQFCDVFDIEKSRQKWPKWCRDLPLDSLMMLIFGRFLPGPKIVALGAATLRVPMFKYIWTSLVSNLLGNTIVILIFTGVIKTPWS